MASVPSPSSSPRLPSPPPIAEDQLSPLPATEEQQKLFSSLDNGASRRIRPGTKAEDMTEGPPLVQLSEIDSAFQLTEHLKALHNFLTHPIGADTTTAVDRETAQKLATPPDNVDKTLWLYELCRFLTQKVNAIIIALFSDSPPCSRVYRIFAHAWFQHRDMFWKVEGRTGLYILFKTVCDAYGLIPEDNYTIPPEAEGLDVSEEPTKAPPMILKRDSSGPGPLDSENTSVIEAGDHTLSTAGTTKRHRHSPSVSATSVSTVLEESEEEEPEQKQELAAQDENGAEVAAATSSEEVPAGSAAKPTENGEASDESEAAEEAEAPAADESHATEEPEKQDISEGDDEPQAKATGAEPEATAGDGSGPAGNDEETQDEVKAEAHATLEQREAEKAEMDEKEGAVADKDKATASE
ncbi:hypothetical protein SLS60_008013 [Paraconiothyrium brasiliense]|uniref:Mob1/phocein n=1 Tax=Paraconiothyrium brasiliense TaxID=300254 RepID=A0ABR3R363_9PLEO